MIKNSIIISQNTRVLKGKMGLEFPFSVVGKSNRIQLDLSFFCRLMLSPHQSFDVTLNSGLSSSDLNLSPFTVNLG